jgi:hypothetical protein
LPRRPVRSAWTATSRGGLPLHDVPPYQRSFRSVHGDPSGGPGLDRVGRATLVPIVSDGSSRVLRDLRIELVLGACLRRSGFDRCWHVGFTDGARDGSSRVRRRCRRLLRDWRRFASEGGWRSWHHDPRRLILHAATARMPWWPSSPAVSTGMGMSVIPKCSSPEPSMTSEPTISPCSLPSMKDGTLAVLSASQRRAPPRALPRTSTFPRPLVGVAMSLPSNHPPLHPEV